MNDQEISTFRQKVITIYEELRRKQPLEPVRWSAVVDQLILAASTSTLGIAFMVGSLASQLEQALRLLPWLEAIQNRTFFKFQVVDGHMCIQQYRKVWVKYTMEVEADVTVRRGHLNVPEYVVPDAHYGAWVDDEIIPEEDDEQS